MWPVILHVEFLLEQFLFDFFHIIADSLKLASEDSDFADSLPKFVNFDLKLAQIRCFNPSTDKDCCYCADPDDCGNANRQ